jgi:RNA polymerase sigma-70 factor (ECF subfamily)
MSLEEPENVGVFQTTHWSLVQRAGADDDQAQREALTQLIRRYSPSLRLHLITSRRIDPGRAEDLIQGFLLTKVLEGKLISKASRERGRFRGFLCTSLDRFVSNELRRDRAKMRAPEKSVSLDKSMAVTDPSLPVDAAFDIAWARQLLEAALENMRRECHRFERLDIWGVFEARILAPILHKTDPVPYDKLVERYGFRSPAQASNVLVSARRMFERTLRALVGEYEKGEAEIDAEITDLQAILSRAGGPGGAWR